MMWPLSLSLLLISKSHARLEEALEEEKRKGGKQGGKRTILTENQTSLQIQSAE